eukprot:Pgem_evm1s6110
MNSYAAVMKGLVKRGINGKGSSYKVSLFDSGAEIMNVPYLQTVATGIEPQRIGLNHPTIAPYGVFNSLDQKKILISIQNEKEWVTLCTQVFGIPELAQDTRYNTAIKRVANRKVLDELVEQQFNKCNADEMMKKLLNHSIAFGQLNSCQGLINHPQLRTCEYIVQGQKVKFIAPAIIQENELPVDGDRQAIVPDLGEHTEQIRKEFRVCLETNEM